MVEATGSNPVLPTKFQEYFPPDSLASFAPSLEYPPLVESIFLLLFLGCGLMLSYLRIAPPCSRNALIASSSVIM